MSDAIKHECGIAFIRLRKSTDYYRKKYGTSFYGLNKMYILMEKQHNRGQDGAGIANIKLNTPPGKKYIDIARSNASTPIKDVFNQAYKAVNDDLDGRNPNEMSAEALKENVAFTGDLFIGHVRYGTFGKNDILNIHPFIRENNWKPRTLLLAGNFNLTNIKELFDSLVAVGQHPVNSGDTRTVLGKITRVLDIENQKLYEKYKAEGLPKIEISNQIAENISIKNVLQKTLFEWDGGYVMVGALGHGEAFVVRDPKGIRPAYYYLDDEILVVASERPVIQTTFNVPLEEVKELPPAHIVVSKPNGEVSVTPYMDSIPQPTPCSFERIYFSRGTDADIYKERKKLGALLIPQVLEAIDYDMVHTVFSSIPNTAQVAFHGMSEGLSEYCCKKHTEQILKLGNQLNEANIREILSVRPRIDQIAVKDAKMRTFITQDKDRDDLVSHVYDVTYGLVKEEVDTLVVVDDSIVRGTTLRQSILKILDRLGPKKIVVVSSAPQIRYPDCYGIDMCKLGEFIAFQAAIALLKESGRSHIINEVYEKSKAQLHLPRIEMQNYVKDIYAPFSDEDINLKIAEMLKTPEIKADIQIIYQTVENLHVACPKNSGDWYFTGNYPTPGGNEVVSRSFVNYIENNDQRAY